MVLVWIGFAAFNAYVGINTIQYMNKTIDQRDEKLKLLRLGIEYQREQNRTLCKISENQPFKD